MTCGAVEYWILQVTWQNDEVTERCFPLWDSAINGYREVVDSSPRSATLFAIQQSTHDRLCVLTTEPDQHAIVICRKWVKRLGLGFHPDTPGADYEPALSAAMIAEYDSDMDRLFRCSGDPYDAGLAAMKESGLI